MLNRLRSNRTAISIYRPWSRLFTAATAFRHLPARSSRAASRDAATNMVTHAASPAGAGGRRCGRRTLSKSVGAGRSSTSTVRRSCPLPPLKTPFVVTGRVRRSNESVNRDWFRWREDGCGFRSSRGFHVWWVNEAVNDVKWRRIVGKMPHHPTVPASREHDRKTGSQRFVALINCST